MGEITRESEGTGRGKGEEEVEEVGCKGQNEREREGKRERSVFQPGLCGPGGSSTARLDLEVIDRQH